MSAVSVTAPAGAIGGVDSWVERHRRVASSLPGAGVPGLEAIRARALTRFAEVGWPSNRLENWRHTSLLFMENEAFAPTGVAHTAGTSGLPNFIERLRADQEGHWLVFVDGRFSEGLSQLGALPAGAVVGPLWPALAGSSELVEAAFGDLAVAEAPALLNAAFAADGAIVRLEPGVVLPAPVHLVFVATTAGAAVHPRNLIVAGAGAQATVMEHFVAFGGAAADGGPACLTNAVTRVQADTDAHITHVKLQLESLATVHLASIDAVQQRGSFFASHSMSFGARLARNDIGSRFDGEHCEVLLNGLYLVDGKRHVDHHTRIEHDHPSGISREYYRGILAEAARGVFTGRIKVAPGAVRTDAVQRTDSLLLSAQAETDARPELEIYADDVKCAHGATVGQLDEDGLFYLRARGLDEADARNVLIYAFAAQALARIEPATLRRRAEAAIRARLPGGEAMEVQG